MEKTTQEKLTESLAELKAQVEDWKKNVNLWGEGGSEQKEELELDMYETIRELVDTVEADKGFIEPEKCRDTDRHDPAYVCAVAAHAEELADTLDDSENALALRVLASYMKNVAYINGKVPDLDLTELAWAFNID